MRSPGLGVSLVVSARHPLPHSPTSPRMSVGANSGITYQASDISMPRTQTPSSLEPRLFAVAKAFNKKANDLSPGGESNGIHPGLEHMLAAHPELSGISRPNRSLQSVSVPTKQSVGPRVLSTAAYKESVRLGLTPEELLGTFARVRPSKLVRNNFSTCFTIPSLKIQQKLHYIMFSCFNVVFSKSFWSQGAAYHKLIAVNLLIAQTHRCDVQILNQQTISTTCDSQKYKTLFLHSHCATHHSVPCFTAVFWLEIQNKPVRKEPEICNIS